MNLDYRVKNSCGISWGKRFRILENQAKQTHC